MPSMQCVLLRQLFPQAPQFSSSLRRSMHPLRTPPQFANGAAQLHVPLEQDSFEAHDVAQLPQCSGSALVDVQTTGPLTPVLQGAVPSGHVHVPSTHA
jgi:hypothetical protein